MTNIKKVLRDDYLPRIQKLEEGQLREKEEAEAKADNLDRTELLSKLGNLEKDKDRDNAKLVDLFSKVGNLMASYSQIQQSVLELQQQKVPQNNNKGSKSGTTTKSGEINLSEIQEVVEEQVTIQREQLVAALKTHVSTVEGNIRVDMKKISESSNMLILNLEKRLESYGTTDHVEGGGTSMIGLEEKFRKSMVQMSHIKTSVEALWNSMGQLSAKIVDLEAEIDK